MNGEDLPLRRKDNSNLDESTAYRDKVGGYKRTDLVASCLRDMFTQRREVADTRGFESG